MATSHPGADRPRPPRPKKARKTAADPLSPMSAGAGDAPDADSGPAASAAGTKPKRVRTGCLTCRQRHLKCDEEFPVCLNCRKSNRECERGVRLNYIDTQTISPEYLIPPSHEWQICFKDDSREIASEYKGGAARYAPLSPNEFNNAAGDAVFGYDVGAPTMSHHALPSIGGMLPAYPEAASATYPEPSSGSYPQNFHSGTTSTFSDHSAHRQSYDGCGDTTDEQSRQAYLTDPSEVLYMQVFVEEVGLWMDSMDHDNHFSRILPFQALHEPMLKQAFLACGARHLVLVNNAYPEEKALDYYNNATQLLLHSLQNPERNSVLCAVTAVILNVYETMSEKALQRMNHIAGARALIKECGWNAKSKGIGGACFWLNVGMEIHSCLHFNWLVAWEPDDWGMDITMTPGQQPGHGIEEEWTHKITYVLAKVNNFRASTPKFQEQTVQAEQQRFNQRLQLWTKLKTLTDRWQECIPRNMHPMAHIPAGQTTSRSCFPEIWIIKRTTVVAFLFYHTAVALLAAAHPAISVDPNLATQMQELKVSASRSICGIVAHVKDRGVASASIRTLAIAGEFITIRREQEEVLDMFVKIKKETGWKVDFLRQELMDKWGWNNSHQDELAVLNFLGQRGNQSQAASFFPGAGSSTMPSAPVPQRNRPPSGIVNPLYRNASFEQPNHPYSQHYVAPAPNHLPHSNGLYGVSGL